jgi:hypothetical protein
MGLSPNGNEGIAMGHGIWRHMISKDMGLKESAEYFWFSNFFQGFLLGV